MKSLKSAKAFLASKDVPCAYCQTTVVSQDFVLCETCEVPVHRQCWLETKTCPVYACGSQQFREPAIALYRQIPSGGGSSGSKPVTRASQDISPKASLHHRETRINRRILMLTDELRRKLWSEQLRQIKWAAVTVASFAIWIAWFKFSPEAALLVSANPAFFLKSVIAALVLPTLSVAMCIRPDQIIAEEKSRLSLLQTQSKNLQAEQLEMEDPDRLCQK